MLDFPKCQGAIIKGWTGLFKSQCRITAGQKCFPSFPVHGVLPFLFHTLSEISRCGSKGIFLHIKGNTPHIPSTVVCHSPRALAHSKEHVLQSHGCFLHAHAAAFTWYSGAFIPNIVCMEITLATISFQYFILGYYFCQSSISSELLLFLNTHECIVKREGGAQCVAQSGFELTEMYLSMPSRW